MTSAIPFITILGVILAGTVVSAVASCIPGFHVYNLMGFMVLGVLHLEAAGIVLAPEFILSGAVAMIVTFAVVNSLPAILLSAPDESAVFTVLPGQQYLMCGRGWEAVMLTACGSLGAAALLAPAALWLLPAHLPRWHRILQPHAHWVLWVVMVFMLMSEWPRGGTRGPGGWRRLLDGWKSTGAGLLTFAMAGGFGFILLYRAPVPAERAFQNLMPAFVGLFAAPGLLVNILAANRPPRQSIPDRLDVTPAILLTGILGGGLGGGMAAYFPGITGGVGGFLAGHAGAQRDERIFLISQGASKAVYYAGALLLFVVPGVYLTRSGAWLIRGLADPLPRNDVALVTATILVSVTSAFVLTDALARLIVPRLHRLDYRRLSIGALALMVAMVAAMTGGAGLLIMITGTGIGLIPVLHGARRMNCLAVLLLPLACNMSGFGPRIAALLGLV